MAYQVIARKYRPQRFSDVVGQEHVTQTLANAVAQNRIAHAYLFCGPRGTGKTTIARIFAKCLNCTGGPKVDFRDDDPRCLEITEGRSIDVLEIDGASNNGVEQVRELRETVKYAPASSKFKIYIIDEVHMLSTAAFNALLKTLEEPPEHVKFMFATTDPEKVLPTILSRCQRFDLRRIPVALITEHLGQIAKKEKVEIEPEALHAVARGADGGMRDAESALDQLISFCGSRIVESDVLSMFGLTARSQIVALASAILRGEAETALRALSELARHGKDLGRLLSDLLGHFRNLLIYQVSKGDLKLLEVTESEAASLSEQSSLANAEALTRVLEVLTDAEGRLREAASRRIFLEVALLKTIQVRNATSIDAVLQRLQQLQAGAGGGAPTMATAGGAAPSPAATRAPETPKPTAAAAPPAASLSSSASGTSVALVGLWQELIEAVGRASPFTKSYLVNAHPVSLVNHVFTIGFDPEFADQMELVNNSKTHTLLLTKLAELGQAQAQVVFIQAEAPAGWNSANAGQPVPSDASTPARLATPGQSGEAGSLSGEATPGRSASIAAGARDFKSDPLIQKALEIFKGQIVEVRG